ncbi:hypothetical protein BKA83DRAFT_670887 [Pisolithus microcarpus]|nr:hypothetical protein BKA83DRAFT_670887 [Pisolithus microcarpus]
MYNGIGLTTPRGSGTNGYVQRNLSALRAHQTPSDRAAAWDIAPPKHREPDEAILEHERKRKVEVKSVDNLLVLPTSLDEAEIVVKVQELREKLNVKNLKPSDTHAIAAAKKAELDKMARALGTKRDYVEGDAFDREKQEENKLQRMVEREERERKREEDRARMQEQRERWQAEQRERERRRRREEDRIRREQREREQQRARERERQRSRERERDDRDYGSREQNERGYRRRERDERDYRTRERMPPPRRYHRSLSGSPPRRSPVTTPPHRIRERSESPVRRHSSRSPPVLRGRDRSYSPPRRTRDRSPSSDRDVSRSPSIRGRSRERSVSAGSSMSVSTSRSRSSSRSD